jgi:hypothetical protein
MYRNNEPEEEIISVTSADQQNKVKKDLHTLKVLNDETSGIATGSRQPERTEKIVGKLPIGKLLKESQIPKLKIILGPSKAPSDLSKNVKAKENTETKEKDPKVSANINSNTKVIDLKHTALRKRLMKAAPITDIVIIPVKKIQRRNMSYWIHYNTRGNAHFNTFGKNALMSKEKWNEPIGPKKKQPIKSADDRDTFGDDFQRLDTPAQTQRCLSSLVSLN